MPHPSHTPQLVDWTKNVWWGLRWGLYFATFFSFVGLIGSVVSGRWYYPEYHMSSLGIIGVYFASGLAGGTAVGIMRPLTRWRLGTFFLGWITATLVGLLIGLAGGLFTRMPWWVICIPAAPFGGLALVMRDKSRDETQSSGRFIAVVVGVGAVFALLMKLLHWW
jgi:hypothetical protein